jgi:uncharacterized membrane protein YuzA (DUF378 family)
MDTSLIVSLAIVTAGLFGFFNFDRLNRYLDTALKGFGKLTKDALKYSLLGLAGLLFLTGIYSIYTWATSGFAPSVEDSLDTFVSDAGDFADRAGDYLKGAYADVRGLSPLEDLHTAADALEAPGHIEHKMGPNISDIMSGIHGGNFEQYHTPRLNLGLGDDCSRTIKHSGNCWGVSGRHFVDDQFINRCNKIFVRAPQSLPWNGNVSFPL